MGDKATFFALVWIVGTLISGTFELMFFSESSTGLLSGVLRIDFAQYTNLAAQIWGAIKLVGEVVWMLMRMVAFDYSFLTGNYLIVRLFLITMSVGMVWTIISTFFGRRG